MLDHKKWAKNDRIFKFFENKQNSHQSLFNEDPKIFSREAKISRKEQPDNSGNMGNNRDICCYENQGYTVSNIIVCDIMKW